MTDLEIVLLCTVVPLALGVAWGILAWGIEHRDWFVGDADEEDGHGA